MGKQDRTRLALTREVFDQVAMPLIDRSIDINSYVPHSGQGWRCAEHHDSPAAPAECSEERRALHGTVQLAVLCRSRPRKIHLIAPSASHSSHRTCQLPGQRIEELFDRLRVLARIAQNSGIGLGLVDRAHVYLGHDTEERRSRFDGEVYWTRM